MEICRDCWEERELCGSVDFFFPWSHLYLFTTTTPTSSLSFDVVKKMESGRKRSGLIEPSENNLKLWHACGAFSAPPMFLLFPEKQPAFFLERTLGHVHFAADFRLGPLATSLLKALEFH